MSPSLSPYPDLEQLKKQAKDLRKAHSDGSRQAAQRLKAHVRRCTDLDEDAILAGKVLLRDAQHVIAREHGYAGWQELREAVSDNLSAPEPRSLLVESVEYEEEQLLPVQILRVDPQPRSDGSRVTLVLLRDPQDRLLPISIGDPEGSILMIALQRRELPRPLSHQVFEACIDQLGGSLHSVVVHALNLKENAFHAHLRLQASDRLLTVDTRPSDGLILAVRQRAPVFVTPLLIEQVGRPLSDLTQLLDEIASLEKPLKLSWQQGGLANDPAPHLTSCARLPNPHAAKPSLPLFTRRPLIEQRRT